MAKIELRIIIIDDNPNIHKDFIKVLTISPKNTQAFDVLDTALFGKDEVASKDDYLPEFSFDTASQGREGVMKIKQAQLEGRPYALAFVDIRMPPGWDGVETIKRLWKIDPNIQVVICTAFSDYNWMETIENLGVNDNLLILKKPFDNLVVKQLACALTKKWLLERDSKSHTELLNQMVKDKTETLQHTLSLLRATLESTTEGVLVVDLNKQILDYNNRFIHILDIPLSLLVFKDENLVQEFIVDKLQDPSLFLKQIEEQSQDIGNISTQVLQLNNGKTLECFSIPHCLNETIVGRVWSFRDITERAFMEKKLEHQATHDALTDLPNRILLHDRIQQAIFESIRNETFFAILFLDLDRFKLVNDSLGHEVGDQLLCAVARRLNSLLRKGDCVARLGGDEFVILIRELKKEDAIFNLTQKINVSFQKPFEIAGRDIMLTTSIGISLYPVNGKTASKLLKNADLAMYQAKEQGGNQFKFYTRILNKRSNKKLQLEMDLRQAIENEQFFLLYQPQLDIITQSFLSVEALIRWQHPDKGIVLPLSFIPAAEESGLIIPIGEWVIRESCKQINRWRDANLPYITIAVNVSAQQLKQPDFDVLVNNILIEYQIPTSCLEIEITENVIISHPEITRMITKLRKVGLKIILDDFGTGNSSLNYLKHVNFDRLKIDRSFVKNISKSRSDEVIIEAVIAMAKSLQSKVMAEGVEAQNQLDFLKNKNCDEVQGYFYSKPLDPEALIEYIKKHP